MWLCTRCEFQTLRVAPLILKPRRVSPIMQLAFVTRLGLDSRRVSNTNTATWDLERDFPKEGPPDTSRSPPHIGSILAYRRASTIRACSYQRTRVQTLVYESDPYPATNGPSSDPASVLSLPAAQRDSKLRAEHE